VCENPGWRAVAALYERRSGSFRDPAVIERRDVRLKAQLVGEVKVLSKST
jgi:hypothetical protein